MNTPVPDPEVPAAVTEAPSARPGWAIAVLCVAALVALILIPLSIASLVRNRALNQQTRGVELAIVEAEATRIAQPGVLRADLERARGQLAPALAGWPSDAEMPQLLSVLADRAREAGAELVSVNELETVVDPLPSVITALRYRLQVRGSWTSIMAFIARISSGALPTLYIEQVSIAGDPPLSFADIVLYATNAATWATPVPAASPTAQPGATPTVDTVKVAEILRLETMMRAAQTMRAWAAYVAYGERILQLHPGHPNAVRMLYEGHVSWAQELAAQGDSEGARSHYTEALRLVPAGPEALEGLNMLDAATAVPTPTHTPPEPTAQPTPTLVIYTVRPGDTLSGLAARYRTTVAALMEANNLRSTTIYVNQRLVIPTR